MAGKDAAAVPLIAAGYVRHCFGDVIKRQLDPLIRQHFGFSAFTNDRKQKEKIRRTLESWGEDNYDSIIKELFETLPPKAVNTRLVRTREAVEWAARGGRIIAISRPGIGPVTRWEAERYEEMEESGLIDAVVVNDGTTEQLHGRVMQLVGQMRRDTTSFRSEGLGRIAFSISSIHSP